MYKNLKKKAMAAGLLEGRLTSELIYMYYQNTIVGRCDGKKKLCNKINQVRTGCFIILARSAVLTIG